MRILVTIAVAAIALGLASPRGASAQNSGFYIGGTGGYGWGTSTHTGQLPPNAAPPLLDCGDGIFVPTPSDCPGDAKFRTKGGLIGGALGWNYWSGPWLFGIEGDYSYAALSGGSGTCGNIPHQCGSKLESLGTLRGRVGTSYNDWTLYATGGWAFGEVYGYDVLKTSGSTLYSGWAIGGGIEKRIAPQLSLKLEYLYLDLGSKELFQAPTPGYGEVVSFKANTIRVGINYSFAPVSAPAPAPMITKGPSLK
jgi:outer membrane immunogenic protein